MAMQGKRDLICNDDEASHHVRLAGAPRQDSLLKFEVLILSPRVGFNLPPILSRHHHVLLITRRVVAQVTL